MACFGESPGKPLFRVLDKFSPISSPLRIVLLCSSMMMKKKSRLPSNPPRPPRPLIPTISGMEIDFSLLIRSVGNTRPGKREFDRHSGTGRG